MAKADKPQRCVPDWSSDYGVAYRPPPPAAVAQTAARKRGVFTSLSAAEEDWAGSCPLCRDTESGEGARAHTAASSFTGDRGARSHDSEARAFTSHQHHHHWVSHMHEHSICSNFLWIFIFLHIQIKFIVFYLSFLKYIVQISITSPIF